MQTTLDGLDRAQLADLASAHNVSLARWMNAHMMRLQLAKALGLPRPVLDVTPRPRRSTKSGPAISLPATGREAIEARIVAIEKRLDRMRPSRDRDALELRVRQLWREYHSQAAAAVGAGAVQHV